MILIIILVISAILLVLAVIKGIFLSFEMRACEKNLEGQQELSRLINETYNPDGTRK